MNDTTEYSKIQILMLKEIEISFLIIATFSCIFHTLDITLKQLPSIFKILG